MPAYKLTYWDGPGKAEPARLAFAVKGVPFEDVTLTRSSWETIKPTTPWGQVPVLEVDGQQLAQSGAINSYVARELGLCPADPFGAAKVDEFCDTVEECSVVCLQATFGLEGDAKNVARKKLAAPGSKLREWLTKIDAKLGANPSGFAVGDSLTFADLRCFCELSAMISGWYDGIPASLLCSYSNIQNHRAKIASLPEVEKYYSQAGPSRATFKPFDPAAAAAGALESPKSLNSNLFLKTDEILPSSLRTVAASAATSLVLHKSTYPANAPSEDRSTLVVGDGFIFAGVWDGHGGVATSNYAETAIYDFFKQHYDNTQGASVEETFKIAYKQTDDTYLATAKKNNDAAALFAGTCAVGTFIDFSNNTVCCSNLGDSRCVVGLYEGGTLNTINMSEDHAACHAREKKRVQDEHPRDPTALVQMSEDDDDWRVKGICAFTRSLGDTQMKDKAAATLYNSYTRGWKVMPRPGVKAKGEPERTKPYISNIPEYKQQQVNDGFAIIACDGVWDEMSSDEAVYIVADLIKNHESDPSCNVADMFIEKVLEKAVERITSTIPEEEDLTLAALKARPQGKADLSHRSCLHDDITCIIVHFQTDPEMESEVASKVVLSSSDPSVMARELFQKIDVNGDGTLDRSEIAGLAVRLGKTLSEADLTAAMAEMDVRTHFMRLTDGDGSVDSAEFEKWWSAKGVNMLRKGKTTRIKEAEGTIAAVMGEIAVQGDDATRSKSTEQIMRLTKTMEGMSTTQLKLLFDALDADKNGTLDREEVKKLVETVLQEAAVTDAVMTSCFDEMDADNSGTVEWDEFANFFDLAQSSV